TVRRGGHAAPARAGRLSAAGPSVLDRNHPRGRGAALSRVESGSVVRGAILLVMAAITVAACGGDNKVTSPTSTAASTTTAAPSTTAVASAPSVATLLTRQIVLAHAGGDDDYPHSTPFAFAESVRAGVDVL